MRRAFAEPFDPIFRVGSLLLCRLCRMRAQTYGGLCGACNEQWLIERADYLDHKDEGN